MKNTSPYEIVITQIDIFYKMSRHISTTAELSASIFPYLKVEIALLKWIKNISLLKLDNDHPN